jgi:hypothetical protein
MRGTGTAGKTLFFLVVLALLVCAGGWLSTALAQYPPPAGTVTASAETDAAPTAASVEVACTVLDTAGSPVANETCTFTIVSQPGADASLGGASVTALTDADGVATATLYTGSTPGIIVVEVDARGISSQVTVATGVELGTAPPTGSSGAPSQLPASGRGGVGGDGVPNWPLALALVATALAATSSYLILRRRASA